MIDDYVVTTSSFGNDKIQADNTEKASRIVRRLSDNQRDLD